MGCINLSISKSVFSILFSVNTLFYVVGKPKIKDIAIVLLTFLLLTVIIRENYYGRILKKFTRTTTTEKSNQFELDEIYSNNQFNSEIVFLGNSISSGVDWNELLGLNISNQGVGLNTTLQMYNRLENVLNEKPKHVFIMGGINDLYKNIEVDDIVKNLVNIITALKDNGIEPVIQSTLFVNSTEKNHEETNKSVMILNAHLMTYCLENAVTYIDINSLLIDDKELKDEYSQDGVHLTPKGYEVWSEVLISTLEDMGYY